MQMISERSFSVAQKVVVCGRRRRELSAHRICMVDEVVTLLVLSSTTVDVEPSSSFESSIFRITKRGKVK